MTYIEYIIHLFDLELTWLLNFSFANICRVQGSEWDEAAFQEAVKRVVADLAP